MPRLTLQPLRQAALLAHPGHCPLPAFPPKFDCLNRTVCQSTAKARSIPASSSFDCQGELGPAWDRHQVPAAANGRIFPPSHSLRPWLPQQSARRVAEAPQRTGLEQSCEAALTGLSAPLESQERERGFLGQRRSWPEGKTSGLPWCRGKQNPEQGMRKLTEGARHGGPLKSLPGRRQDRQGRQNCRGRTGGKCEGRGSELWAGQSGSGGGRWRQLPPVQRRCGWYTCHPAATLLSMIGAPGLSRTWWRHAENAPNLMSTWAPEMAPQCVPKAVCLKQARTL